MKKAITLPIPHTLSQIRVQSTIQPNPAVITSKLEVKAITRTSLDIDRSKLVLNLQACKTRRPKYITKNYKMSKIRFPENARPSTAVRRTVYSPRLKQRGLDVYEIRQI